MRVTHAFDNPARRKVALTALAVLTVIGISLAWVLAGAASAAFVAVVGVVLLVVTKALMELFGDQKRNRDGSEVRLRAMEQAVSERVRSLETTVSEQAASINQVESAATKQVSFNDAVLGRVRSVESAATERRSFNEAVLNRVRAVEAAKTKQAKFNEAVLDRVRAVESTRPRQDTIVPPGQTRRVEHAREMVVVALNEVEGWKQTTGWSAHDTTIGTAAHATQEESANDGPLVSIIVTCFNEERFVSAALESIRRQSFRDWECLVVDDASTDASVAEIEHFVASDDRFTLIQQPENRDVSVARNTALAVARGRYVMFLDSDDLLMRDSIQDRVDTLRSVTDPDVVGSFTGMRISDQDIALSELVDKEPGRGHQPLVDFVSSRGECPFGTPCPLLRLDVVRAHDGFNESQSLAADWEFWLRLMRSGFAFVPTGNTTVVYRQNRLSKAQSRASSHVIQGHALIRAAYENADPDPSSMSATYPFGRPLPYYEALVTQARRTIQYAATTLLRGEVESFETILKTLEPGSWPLLKRHADVSGKAADGFRRAAGLEITDLPLLDDEFGPLASFLRSRVRTTTS